MSFATEYFGGISAEELQVQADRISEGQNGPALPSVRFNPRFLRGHPTLSKKELILGLLLETSDNTQQNQKYATDGMGTTAHHAFPQSVVLPESQRRMGLFVKPFEKHEAEYAQKELDNSITALQRGINCPAMIMVAEFNNQAILYSELDYLASPLSLRRLDYQIQDPRFYTPTDFLIEYIRYIAFMHNQGVVHGDLHLGNIGSHRQKNSRPDVMFFDFEDAVVLPKDDLRLKNKGTYRTGEQVRDFEYFENYAVADLSTFMANLVFYGNFPMPEDELAERIAGIYQLARKPRSYARVNGMKEGTPFMNNLQNEFQRQLAIYSKPITG